MKTLRLVIAVGILSAGLTQAAPTQSDWSKLIVGQWTIDSQPPRFPRFLADGTWTLMYMGDTSVQTGQWRIEGKTLIRYYSNGEARRSEILKLDKSEMVLHTQGPADHYKRLTALKTVTVPAKDAKIIRVQRSPRQ